MLECILRPLPYIASFFLSPLCNRCLAITRTLAKLINRCPANLFGILGRCHNECCSTVRQHIALHGMQRRADHRVTAPCPRSRAFGCMAFGSSSAHFLKATGIDAISSGDTLLSCIKRAVIIATIPLYVVPKGYSHSIDMPAVAKVCITTSGSMLEYFEACMISTVLAMPVVIQCSAIRAGWRMWSLRH